MPRPSIRRAGRRPGRVAAAPPPRLLAALIATVLAGPLAACTAGDLVSSGSPAPAGPSAAPSAAPPSPSSDPGHLAWVEDLSFAGGLSGRMSAVVAAGPTTRSECTGRNSRTLGSWASTFYGEVGKEVWGVVLLIKPYRGAGAYSGGPASAEVVSQDASRVWGLAGDPVSVTVAPDEESGSVDASLSDLASPGSKLRLSGRWSCRT